MDVQFYDIALNDIDGNGFLDIVYGNDGNLGVFLNPGPPTSQPGDFDGDGDVDGNDFLEWQKTDGTPAGLADWNGNYGTGVTAGAAAASVPEPTTLILLMSLGVVGGLRRYRRI